MKNKMKHEFKLNEEEVARKVLEDLIELSGKGRALIGIDTLSRSIITCGDMTQNIEQYFFNNKLIQDRGRDSRGDSYVESTKLGRAIHKKIKETKEYTQLRDKYSSDEFPQLHYMPEDEGESWD